MIAVGLMSGTSLDGVDAVLVRIEPRGPSYAIDVLQFETMPFDDDLETEIRTSLPPYTGSVASLARLHQRVGAAFARSAHRVAGAMRVDYIASHGLTMWHDGASHTTLQIGNPFTIREALSSTVCYDFRSADCAVGGHGAPLVPYVDALLLGNEYEDRVAVNIGGIANITGLARGAEPHDVLAFDTGPGNMLIDALMLAGTDGAQTFDQDGQLARSGSIDLELLDALLAEPYFALSPPKSAGREQFGAQLIERHRERFDAISLEDGIATLTELTAVSVAEAITGIASAHSRVLVSGGGAHNTTLLERLRARLPDALVETTAAVGIDVDAKEAIAFALFGYETLRERAGNVPRVTGASRAVPLGAIVPFELNHLLSEVERECRR